ncbi:condensation domain-containing protein [Streptomyces rubradiris]|uniref:condensation domain-containing protein n=1 Tax=Streptomyces rubradiris TaxID=285531 RepID=UPI0033F5251D
MKFIDIWDLEVTAGQLTVWRPTAGPPHSSDWMPDARPASYLQEAHLSEALNSATSGRGPSWLATAFELPGRLDEYALCKAFTDWINRHEVLRSRLEPYADGDLLGMYRSTVRPGAVGLVRTEHGHFDDPRVLSARLEAVLDGHTDPLAWPSFVFLTVRHPDSTTVCVGLDHHNVDGYAVLLIAHEIRELYDAALDDRRARLTEVGSYLDFAGPERQDAARLHGDHEAVRQWRECVAEGGGRLPEFVLPVVDGDAPAPVPQTGGLDWLLDAEGARAFEAVCRRGGGDFFSGLLACHALAGQRLSGQESFRTVTPFHTRGERRFHRSLGWYVGIAPVSVAVRGGDGFEQVLKESGEALRRARPLACAPLARLTELLGLPLEPRFMVSYMDIRSLPGAGRWTEWNATALRSRRIHPHEVYLWLMRTREGVYVSHRHPDSGPARTAVRSYLTETSRLVRQTAAGDLPSAMPRPRPHASAACTCGGRGKEPTPC